MPLLSYGRNGTKGNNYFNTTTLYFDISQYKTLTIEQVSINENYPCTIQIDSMTVCNSNISNFTYDISEANTLLISIDDANASAGGTTKIVNLVCE